MIASYMTGSVRHVLSKIFEELFIMEDYRILAPAGSPRDG